MTSAADYRTEAANHRAAAQDSFDRCDTDGFVSQWASGLSAQEADLKAHLAENDGRTEVPALFDLDGNLVAAKLTNTRYGMAWGLLSSDDPRSRFVGWFNPSKAQKGSRARDAKKGYYVGYVMAKATAKIVGSGTGLSGAMSCSACAVRNDGGFSRDVIITDNGHDDLDKHMWYDVNDGKY
jgi:hypothetical protein